MQEHLVDIERLVDELTARMRNLSQENGSLKEEIVTQQELLQENEEALTAVRQEHRQILAERDRVIEELRKEQRETEDRLRSLLGKLQGLAGQPPAEEGQHHGDTYQQGELIDRS
ncbi:MAG: hypothetical protein ACP5DY_04910 [Thermovirgaceae bacterium]